MSSRPAVPRSRRPLRIVLAGEESAAARVLRSIEHRGHRVVGVLTSGLRARAEKSGHRVWEGGRVEDPGFAAELRATGTDLLLNVHSLHVVTDAVLAAPRLGCFNLHPGPLPEYAGLDTVSWAIYRREEEHGVTLHEMVSRVDAGPIVFESRFPIRSDETAFSLYSRCVEEGIVLIERLLEIGAEGAKIPRTRQDPAGRRFWSRKPPQGGRVSWERSARDVDAFVRACDYGPFPSPWGHPKTRSGTAEIELLAVAPTGRPAEMPPGTLRAGADETREVACCDEWLRLLAVRVDGRRAKPSEVLAPSSVLG